MIGVFSDQDGALVEAQDSGSPGRVLPRECDMHGARNMRYRELHRRARIEDNRALRLQAKNLGCPHGNRHAGYGPALSAPCRFSSTSRPKYSGARRESRPLASRMNSSQVRAPEAHSWCGAPFRWSDVRRSDPICRPHNDPGSMRRGRSSVSSGSFRNLSLEDSDTEHCRESLCGVWSPGKIRAAQRLRQTRCRR